MKYARRAEKEMLAVAQFSDWNPSHFLDVAEMTAALAIGYDWLYDVLEPASREIISQAIIDKGLHATENKSHLKFYTRDNNWNQVCNAGLVMGALAIYELLPEEATAQISKSVKSNPIAQASYGPDGVYPEGYSYWDYGTTFEVMLIESLRSALGTSFDLEKKPGFLESAHFMQAMVAPSGIIFNYSDCGRVTFPSNPLLYWFANETGDASVLWWERNMRPKQSRQADSSRILPIILMLAQRFEAGTVSYPDFRLWKGNGVQPVALYRSNWTSDKSPYLAMKGGSAYTAHAHMDAGGFIYEYAGLRWSDDPGAQDYHSMEKVGLNIWSRTQQSDRWKIFRYNNTAHNTLTVNDKMHIMKGNAPITSARELDRGCEVKVNLTPVLEDVEKAVRTFLMDDNGRLCIKDEIKAGDNPCNIKWLMWTRADAEITNRNTVTLSMEGKRIRLKASGSSTIKASILSNTPVKPYDCDNGKSLRVCFEMQIKPDKEGRIKVEFLPQDAKESDK